MATRHVAVWTAAGMMAAAAAWGGDCRYQTYVTGERIGAMGGAGVALGRGVDACRYNPAGLSEAERASVSLTANLYGIQKRETKGGLLAGDDARSDEFVTIPSLVGGVNRLSDNWVAGFSIVEPEKTTTAELTRKRSGRLYSYRLDDQSIWAGPSLAWGSGEGWSVGVSAFGIYRSQAISVMMAQTGDNGDGFMIGEGVDAKSLEALAELGVRWRGAGGWRVGASAQSASVHLYDSAKYGVGVGTGDTIWSVFSKDVEMENRQPWQVAVGVGFEKEKDWAVGVDATWRARQSFESTRETDEDGAPASTWLTRRSTVDVNAGGEYYLFGTYPIRAGFYTGFSSVADVMKAGESATEDIDAYGVTFGVGRETEQSSVAIGVNYVWGKGHEQGSGEGMFEDVKTRARMKEIYFTLATSYYF